jgi:hypothetical protein
VISAAKRWAAGKASPKPQPRDPNPRRYSSTNSQNINTSFTNANGDKNGLDNQATFAQGNITKFARNASPRARKMWEGLQESFKGGWSTIHNPKVRQHFQSFFKSMVTILLVMYAVIASLMILYLPAASFIATLAPGFIAQIFTMVPLWSFNIARKRTPMAVNQLFLDELERLSPQRAKELEQQMKTDDPINKNWLNDLYHDLRTSWHFTRYSLMWLSFSIIPIVGSLITWLGQTWLVADKMGWNLLSVYTISAKKMSYRQQKHWMRARKWRIIGFTLPFVLIASIPIIGPLVLGISQAATAHIYFHLLSKDSDVTEKKKQASSPLVEFKTPS